MRSCSCGGGWGWGWGGDNTLRAETFTTTPFYTTHNYIITYIIITKLYNKQTYTFEYKSKFPTVKKQSGKIF